MARIRENPLSASSVDTEVSNATREERIISDKAAVTIAGWWQSSNDQGRVLGYLARGEEFKVSELIENIKGTLEEFDLDGWHNQEEDRPDLEALLKWAENRSW